MARTSMCILLRTPLPPAPPDLELLKVKSPPLEDMHALPFDKLYQQIVAFLYFLLESLVRNSTNHILRRMRLLTQKHNFLGNNADLCQKFGDLAVTKMTKLRLNITIFTAGKFVGYFLFGTIELKPYWTRNRLPLTGCLRLSLGVQV